MKKLTPQVERLIRLLERVPLGSVITSNELAEKMHIAELRGPTMTHPALAKYRRKLGKRVYWGQPQTISDWEDSDAKSEGFVEEEQASE